MAKSPFRGRSQKRFELSESRPVANKYGLMYLFPSSRYLGQTSKKWYSSYVRFILHELQVLSWCIELLYLPVLLNKSKKEVRKGDNAFK